ncbi:nitrate- and nitrite sensing domain-containing protein [Streptomyces triculaminicus]|uniref:histidine kinase n=3 Tax=Streptomyces TaxID=1883 RepID=A0A939JQ55_9ACTN|nr:MULTISPECIES: nitrate- and nitrite sensing domain-containing protein [Streptomyces]MBO0655228.1 nitrate- and nitrite sensing domain-containing protein [Streptomyces triculaminicus]QSY50916.1 nitrate- and nitrite sensing domain-containing protein [Streptomyces griseocarneus]
MQGRFKRDGSAAAEPEPRGATDRGTPVDAPNGGEPTERPKGKSANSTGSRIALRNWRISTRLVSLLALPVVAATTLGALRIETSLENVDQLDHMKLLTDMTGKATALANALQEERDKSAGPLIRDRNSKDDAVVSSRQRTDRNIEAFTETTKKARPDDPTMVGVQSTLVDISRELKKIQKVRESAYKDSEYIAKTVGNYNTLITSLLSLSQDMAQATSNSDMITATRALATFSAAKEYASIQRAVLSAGLAPVKGAHLSANDLQYGQSALSSEEQALIRFTAIRSGDSAELLKSLNGGITDITAANTFATRAFGNTNSFKDEKTSYKDWYDQDTVKITEMVKIETTLLNQMEQKAAELRDEANQDAILNGVLIILVLGISLAGAFVVARSMVRSLRRLQDTAQKVAQERLPELVKQLSETDPQDVDTSVESVGVHSRDEIGKVAAAFDEVHQEAVRLAAEQALLRGNVNAMFTNLSRRSQGLIQRQLSLISELESREADPDQLSSLFRLDHLATRMRRNGENLLVLAGEEPGRRWTRPVPLVDVLRAAASEVEQYERIELSGVPPTEVAGRVVNDLVHLLAELLENATSFSSPQTKVKVTGHALPDGRVLVEIHDTGIGLSPEDLAAINERLASPPTVDVSVSRRMGLFVVGRLSLRHGIRIQLRPSDSGGTTALVMLPVDVAQGHKKPAPGGAAGAGAGAGAPGGQGAPAAGPGQQQRRPAIVPRGSAPGGGLPGRPAQGPGPSGGAAAGSLFDTSPRDKGGPGLPVRGNSGPAAVPPPAGAGGRPQLPARNGGGSAPAAGDAGRQAPAWGNAQAPAGNAGRKGPGAPADDWPMPDGGSARSGQDAPRGHDETDTSGGRPAAPGNKHKRKKGGQPAGGAQLSGGPGDTAQFPPVPATEQPSAATGSFPRPGAGDTAQFPPVPAAGEAPNARTGSFELPGGPSATGQFARPAQNEQRQNTTGQYDRPATHGGPQNEATGRFAQPDAGGARDNAPANNRFELPGGPAAGGRTDRPAPGGEGAGTPLFSELESHWFRDEPQAGVPQQPADSARPMPRRATGRTPAPAPQNGPQAGPQGGGPLTGGPQPSGTDRSPSQDAWPGSPNDERWRRAEQVREPAAGGTTSSGLPKRVPRANLVEGTAETTQTQSLPTGPAVSRAPDDVRGRLTNLRRGIQQGRQAGSGPATGSHNVGPTHQQER